MNCNFSFLLNLIRCTSSVRSTSSYTHRHIQDKSKFPISIASSPSKVVPPSKVAPSSKVAVVEGYLFIFLGFHFASSFFSNSIILIFYWDEPVRDFFVNNLKPIGKSSLSRFYWEIWEILLFPN